jgi:excisionase family DNA binding protein
MYSTQEAATALGVSRQTIFVYVNLEKDPLPAERIGRRLTIRIREDELINFAHKYNMSIIALKQ